MQPTIAVFCGGTSSERDVSLGSGKACALALARHYPTRKFDITSEATLPSEIDPRRHIVFSTLHGTFGEDGGMQTLLTAAGVSFAGCDAEASALTFNKQKTKEAVSRQGVIVAKGMSFHSKQKPSAEALRGALGNEIILKPNCQGSSVGLHILTGLEEIRLALNALTPGEWVAEERIRGREVTIGLLLGRAMGIVEIVPKSGHFDFASKYTKGLTEYHAPADLDVKLAADISAAAETAFAACGCRDYARIDFMISEDGRVYFLEINTLPGMKDTSLLPMSARCSGMDFSTLVCELVAPAVERFKCANASVVS